jgi:hypothetical protein
MVVAAILHVHIHGLLLVGLHDGDGVHGFLLGKRDGA